MKAFDSSKYVAAVFFDLQKAFDRVWHKGLLCKLEAAGVRGAPLQWFQSYLSDRRQSTRVADAVSSTLQLSAGVPQGAILSPLLFILYVNDITQVSSADVNLLADDTSSFLADKCPHRLCARLQELWISLLSGLIAGFLPSTSRRVLLFFFGQYA